MNIVYSGSGESITDPIRIKGIAEEEGFLKAEISFIESALGIRGVQWFLRFRREHRKGGQTIDEIGVSAYCGHMTSIFFTKD